MSQNVDVKIGDWISRGFNRYTSQWQNWTLVSLVSLLIIGASSVCLIIPLFFIVGPLHHSLFYILTKQQKGDVVTVSDITYGFKNRFWDFAQVCLIIGGISLLLYLLVFGFMMGITYLSQSMHEPSLAIIGVGIYFIFMLAMLVASAYFMPRISFVTIHMFHRGIKLGQAYREVDAKVKKSFWWVLLFVFLVQLISSLGLYACYIGYIFTFPLSITMIGEAYEDLFNASPTMGQADPNNPIQVA